jgi:NitT/TauT family transport system substrate-binding protein
MSAYSTARAGVATALACAIFGWFGAAQAQTTVRINVNPVPYQSPIFIAAKEGFDARNGLKIELVKLAAGAQNTPALVNGTLTFSSCTFDNVANFHEQGKQVVAIYKLVERPTLDLVVANKITAGGVTAQSPLADRLKALKGFKFGISETGGPSDVFLRALLHEAGLIPGQDVEVVRMGSIAGLFAGLKSGQIDGYVLSPPSPQQAEKAGVGKVLIKISQGEVPALAKFPSVAICTTQERLDKEADVVKRFVKALQEANDWMRKNEAETVKVGQALFPNVKTEIWKQAVELSIPAISADGRFEQDEIEKAFAVYKNAGASNIIPDPREGLTWTNAYLPK